jgi:VWFA-related protein
MKLRTAALFLLCLLCATAWPQSAAPAPQSAPSSQPEVVSHEAPAAFSSRVNLVSVPVVVRDREGQPVGNLRQEDFQLFDKGRAQVIARFAIEESASETSFEKPGPASAPDARKPSLPDRYVAYLFDDVHMKPGDLLNARQAANRHLEQTLDTRTRAAIFTTSGRTTQDFTADAEKLHATVNRIQPWEGILDKQHDCPYVSYYLADMLINRSHALSPGLSDNQVISMMNADPALAALVSETIVCEHLPQLAPGTPVPVSTIVQILWPLRNAAGLALAAGVEETRTSLSAMRDLVRSMSALPGNRSVVMVSPGFLLSEDHRLNENDIFEKAIHAGVTINTLDVRGLAATPGFTADDKGYTSGYAGQMAQYESDAASLAQDLLGEVAAGTGGTFFHNNNGLEEGLKELAARPEYVYVLGFSPDNLKLDGSYHGLKVTLKNGAGLTAEARRGYWAPNHAVSAAEQAQEEVEDAVFSRQEISDIPVKLHTEIFKQSEATGAFSGNAQLLIEARVDLNTLKFRKADDRNRDTLTVVTGLFDENGRYIKGTQTVLELQLKDQTLESVRGSGPMKVSKVTFDLPPGRYVVRVVVRDTEGRSMAAQNQGVDIR